ncbi:MAG: VPLPA-CTERM sorting domain-containing protein [Methylococcaceae bacterium]
MKKIFLLVFSLLLTGIAQASQVQLIANLRAPAEDGSNPDIFTDKDRVPSNASGIFRATLDTDNLVLTNVSLNVTGMLQSDLRKFGPNSTPFHIHLPNSGLGTFGFNVIDLSFEADASSFSFNSTGFSFQRESVSILEEDQGAFFGLGIHPGNDVIVDRLLDESFLLIHSNKDIFTNTVHPPQFLDGFPFGELRGEITVVPVPAAVWFFATGLIGLTGLKKRKNN